MEFCEDQAANGVAYTEARFSPHLMASEDGEVGAEQMLKAALEGFREGEERFGTKVGGQNPFSILGDKMNLRVRLGKLEPDFEARNVLENILEIFLEIQF